MEQVRKVGRPAGSGAQLPPATRAKQSRKGRLQAGAIRVEIILDTEAQAALHRLIEHWGCRSKKEAVERAIAIAASAIAR